VILYIHISNYILTKTDNI